MMKCLAALILLCGCSLQAETSSGRVTVLGLAADTVKKSATEVAAFSGEAARVDIVLEAPIGSKLALQADVLQLSSGIAAPLSAGIKLEGPIDFSKQSRQITEATIPMPKVQRRTEFLVRLRARGDERAEFRASGEFRIVVYPHDDFSELRDLFSPRNEETESHLNVFGPDQNIRSFLKDHKIPFEDRGDGLPTELRPGAVYVGEAETEELSELVTQLPRIDIILFSQPKDGLPGIYRTITPNGSITRITLPILAKLSSDPLSQKTFADLLSQSVTQSSN